MQSATDALLPQSLPHKSAHATVPPIVEPHETRESRETRNSARHPPSSGTFVAPRWRTENDFLVVTALGPVTGPVLVLDEASKERLGIPKEKLVVLPFETRRVQLAQARAFLAEVASGDTTMGAFQLRYLLGLYEVSTEDAAVAMGLSEVELEEIMDEELDLCPSEMIAAARALNAHLENILIAI